MCKKSITVTNIDAAQLVNAAMKFDSKIMIIDNEKNASINAKSLMGVMLLATRMSGSGLNLELNTEGTDAEDALAAIESCLSK